MVVGVSSGGGLGADVISDRLPSPHVRMFGVLMLMKTPRGSHKVFDKDFI